MIMGLNEEFAHITVKMHEYHVQCKRAWNASLEQPKI